jgi:hypothetical protein
MSPEVKNTPSLLTPRDHSTATSSPAHAQGGVPSVVAAYVDALTADGKLATTSTKARIGKEAKQLVADGYAIEAMIEPAQYIARHGYSPSLLPVLVQDGIRRPGTNREKKYEDALRRAQEWRPGS